VDRALINRIGGSLTGNISIRGTTDDPILSGNASFSEGLLGLPDMGLTYHDIAGSVTFEQNLIVVDSMSVRSGQGRAWGGGTIRMTELTLGDVDLAARSSSFLAVDRAEYSATASADLTVRGTTKSPLVEGSVDIEQANVRLQQTVEEFEDVTLTIRDLQTLEDRFGVRVSAADTTTFDLYEATALDIHVRMDRGTWLRSTLNPTLDVEFIGDLDVQKEAFGDLAVFGTIDVLPERSRFRQFGKNFGISRGELTFNGPVDDPLLDFQADYVIRSRNNTGNEVVILLNATGRPEELEITLSSDPVMDRTDIVSYLAFGRPANASVEAGGDQGSLATDLAVGQVAGAVEALAGSELGLDVVQIEQRGRDINLTAGKYVSQSLYLGLSQPISFSGTGSAAQENPTEVTAELELLRQLVLRLAYAGQVQVNLLFRKPY
jgi:translocation and assembly module TamB